MKHWDLPWLGSPTEVNANLVVALMDTMGSSSFSSEFFKLLHERFPISMLTLSVIEPDTTLRSLWLEASWDVDRNQLVESFKKLSEKYYRHDPARNLLARLWAMTPESEPVIMVHHMKTEEVSNRQWRHERYEAFNIIERLAIGAFHPSLGVLILALFRREDIGRFTEADLEWICGAAPLLLRLLIRQEGIHFGVNSQSNLPALEGRLGQFASKLSNREVQVCSRILLGCSFDEIAEQLKVKRSSIKSYRERAFEKLAITSRFELFALMLK